MIQIGFSIFLSGQKDVCLNFVARNNEKSTLHLQESKLNHRGGNNIYPEGKPFKVG